MNRLSSVSLMGTALALTGAMLCTGCSQGGGDGAALAASPPPQEIVALLNAINTKLDALASQTTDLSGVTQSWNKNLSSATRFVTAFTGAVLDKNTGLVWEQAPDAGTQTWAGATYYCVNKNVGGTVGWRLPSVVELNSVRDPSLPAPFVPASVFTGVQSAGYWSATTNAVNSSNAWYVDFLDGFVYGRNKSSTLHAWCVRGGMQESAY